ncbi:DUF2975 domain-containing protein [Apilactobacillus ozensis]|uniref:DUF2975 domain-containing protein n=1 Tax=Apilactobacillus ozensis TaxID=866801 RepID=UPI00200A9726|nr:DUF2975 domain-containing protein [Apilactobacillus ozensis]MCK8607790.1 DUF2975 domain-containing protein [Apilactobacillus ozensis]
MESLDNILFSLIRILINLFIVFMYVMAIIFSAVSIALFFHLGSNDIWGVSNSNLSLFLYNRGYIATLFIVFMILSLIFICTYVKKIIINLKLKQYFINKNAIFIKKILYSFIVFILCNAFLNCYLYMNDIYHITDISILGKPSFINYVIYIIILITIYIIYTIFKYGLNLKNDSDSII